MPSRLPPPDEIPSATTPGQTLTSAIQLPVASPDMSSDTAEPEIQTLMRHDSQNKPRPFTVIRTPSPKPHGLSHTVFVCPLLLHLNRVGPNTLSPPLPSILRVPFVSFLSLSFASQTPPLPFYCMHALLLTLYRSGHASLSPCMRPSVQEGAPRSRVTGAAAAGNSRSVAGRIRCFWRCFGLRTSVLGFGVRGRVWGDGRGWRRKLR